MTARTLLALGLAALAGGCADSMPLAVAVTGSDFCQISEKITWEPRDTPGTIHQVRRHNAKVDKNCKPGQPQPAPGGTS